MPKHTYTIQISTPRSLTEAEVERVVSSALDQLATLLAVPDETPRHIERIVIRPRPEHPVEAA
jgi:hypothetical protein